jgi:MFS family permease
MKYRHRTLGLLFFLSMITYIDRVCIAFAGPRMQDDIGLTPEQYGLVLSAFALAYMIFEIPSGAWGDKAGPRKLLTRIVVWWSVFTSLTGAAANYFWLLIVRFMFGAGEAGAFPNSSGAISRWFPAAERGRAQGVIWMASRVGGALTPFLVVPIQAAYGWRMSFYVFGILGIIWAVVWYGWFRDHPGDKKGVTDEELKEIGVGRAPPAHVKMPWGKVLGSGNFWTILLMYNLYCYGAFFYLSWYPTYLVRGRGFSDTELLAYSWLPFALGGTANYLGGFVSDRLVKKIGLKWGRRSVGLAGLGASAAFTLATALTPGKLAGVILLALGFAGSDFMLPVAWAVCLDIGRKHAGAVTGAMNTAGQLGSFTVAAAFGFVVTAFGNNYNAPLYPMALLTAISALLWLKIDPTKQLVPEEVQALEDGQAPTDSSSV